MEQSKFLKYVSQEHEEAQGKIFDSFSSAFLPGNRVKNVH